MSRTHNTRLSVSSRQLLLAVVVCVVLASAVASVGSASGVSAESTPAHGDDVEEVPDEIVFDVDGDELASVAVTVEHHSGEPVHANPVVEDDDGLSVTVPIEDVGNGLYLISYTFITTDGEIASGSQFFSAVDEVGTDDDTEQAQASFFAAGVKGTAVGALFALVVAPFALGLALYTRVW